MEFEGTSDPEADTPFVNGAAPGANENHTTDSSANTIEPTVESDDEATLPDVATPSPFKPGDYVQWESNNVLRMPEAKRLSHFSDDGNFAFLEGSTTGIPVEELIAADPLPSSASETDIGLGALSTETERAGIRATDALEYEVATAPNAQDDSAHTFTPESDELASDGNNPSSGATSSDEECDAAPESDENPLDSSILSAIDQANGIDRNPGNSVIDYFMDKKFHQAWLDRLYARWDDGKKAYFVNFLGRCEIVYLVHKETVKPGCKGGFSAALHRLDLAASTAYDMIARHRVRIGEIPDPDAYDSRDDEEEENEEKTGATRGVSNGRVKKRKSTRPQTAVITLSGTIAEAVNEIQSFYHKANPREAIQFCVLRVWSGLKAPLAKQTEDNAEPSTTVVGKPKRKALILDDDFLGETNSLSNDEIANVELPPHISTPNKANGLSDAL